MISGFMCLNPRTRFASDFKRVVSGILRIKIETESPDLRDW